MGTLELIGGGFGIAITALLTLLINSNAQLGRKIDAMDAKLDRKVSELYEEVGNKISVNECDRRVTGCTLSRKETCDRMMDKIIAVDNKLMCHGHEVTENNGKFIFGDVTVRMKR